MPSHPIQRKFAANSLIKAVFVLFGGLLLGAAALEAILRLNPALLFGEMSAPVPLHPPLQTIVYDVYASDGNIYHFQPKLVRPILPGEDRIEAHVTYQSDEFGFRNPAPLPPEMDIVVLGRSFTLGAEVDQPWPALLAGQTHFQVLNLAKSFSNAATKEQLFRKYGLPRRPWLVIIEVAPLLDVLEYEPLEYEPAADGQLYVHEMLFPLGQTFLIRAFAGALVPKDENAVLPLPVRLVSGREELLTSFVDGVSALDLDSETVRRSSNWTGFQDDLLALTGLIRAHGACVAWHYAPTKLEIYLPLLADPNELAPLLPHLYTWQLDEHNRLVKDNSAAPDLLAMRANVGAMRDLLAELAAQNGVIWIDPGPALSQAALEESPYLRYDSHWNALGHQVVAQARADHLSGGCP